MGSGCCKQSHSDPCNTDVDGVTQSNPAASTTTPENTIAVRATQPDLELSPAGAETDSLQGMKVTDPTIAPYKWICSLEILTVERRTLPGTGFKIHIPGINRCMIVTAGHLTHTGFGDSIDNITITFPGQAPFTVNSYGVFASAEFMAEDHKWEYDYGMIALADMNSDEGFGWSSIVPDNELIGCNVTKCGYSKNSQSEKPEMLKIGKQISKVTDNQIFYNNDTQVLKGDGSPVYMLYKGNWTVVGIDNVFNYFNTPNNVCRFTSKMVRYFLEKSQNLKKYALRSVQFPDVYIRCDAQFISHAMGKGGGTINCQYKPPSDSEAFYIFPLEVTPSSAQEQKNIVVLQNVKWSNAYVRMNGSGVTQYVASGGGVVNCQWSGIRATSWESFVFKKDQQQQYYFQSVQFPNCFIRVDATGITSHTDRSTGGGVVNCQFHNTENDVTSWEKFHLELQ